MYGIGYVLCMQEGVTFFICILISSHCSYELRFSTLLQCNKIWNYHIYRCVVVMERTVRKPKCTAFQAVLVMIPYQVILQDILNRFLRCIIFPLWSYIMGMWFSCERCVACMLYVISCILSYKHCIQQTKSVAYKIIRMFYTVCRSIICLIYIYYVETVRYPQQHIMVHVIVTYHCFLLCLIRSTTYRLF
jgi:hypothetical protein